MYVQYLTTALPCVRYGAVAHYYMYVQYVTTALPCVRNGAVAHYYMYVQYVTTALPCVIITVNNLQVPVKFTVQVQPGACIYRKIYRIFFTV